MLAGRDPVLVHLWDREQGIVLPADNPRGVTGVHDLPVCTVALRAPGTGTRCSPAGPARRRRGRQRRARSRVATHLEAALAVATGLADAAIGLRATAVALGLDFVPLTWEPYQLALPEDALAAAFDLLSTLSSAPPMPGFDLAGAGEIRRLLAQPTTSTPRRY